MHTKNIITAGKKISEATKALIMVHGRGGSAEDILSLANHLEVKDFALAAPQATNNTWYPYSFIAPTRQNEPWLSSALDMLKQTTDDLISQGIAAENIYLLGFSQGACLTLEFAARHAQRWGGIIAFTGGLIGDKIERSNYNGNFNDTPVFIGSSNPDMHVPVERVYATTNILKEMGASVTEKVYPNMGHTIIEDEMNQANKIVNSSVIAND
jgi:phospholipase/carboxylesterase